MDSISTLRKYLKAMPGKMTQGATFALHKDAKVLLREFSRRSPVDTGRYKSMWKMNTGTFGVQNPSVRLYNDDVEKAYYMEEGAELSKAPWYYPYKNGVKRKRSGKLIVRNGRVWAGGISPGHKLTVKGAIGPVLYDNNRRQRKLAINIAAGIIERIK